MVATRARPREAPLIGYNSPPFCCLLAHNLSGRCVDPPNVAACHLSQGRIAIENKRFKSPTLSDRSPLRRISLSLTAIRPLQFPLRVGDLPVRRVGRLLLRIAEQRNPDEPSHFSADDYHWAILFAVPSRPRASRKSPHVCEFGETDKLHQHCNRFNGACARRNTRNRDRCRTNRRVSEDFQRR